MPDWVHSGEAAERECLAIQADVLAQIGASQNQIDYVNHVAETRYWEKPYNQHDW